MKLLITKKAQKELDKIPDQSAKKITGQILKLASNPFPSQSKKLKGNDNYTPLILRFPSKITYNTPKLKMRNLAE